MCPRHSGIVDTISESREDTSGGRGIALVAHDNKLADLLQWAASNRDTLRQHQLFATGTTGTMLEFEVGLPTHRFLSGPVGGDQQIGAKIAQGNWMR